MASIFNMSLVTGNRLYYGAGDSKYISNKRTSTNGRCRQGSRDTHLSCDVRVCVCVTRRMSVQVDLVKLRIVV